MAEAVEEELDLEQGESDWNGEQETKDEDSVETKSKQPSMQKEKKETKALGAKRRGPGRPPKKAPAPPLASRGIVDSPSDAENRLEFVIGTPEIFKKLFTYYRQLKARDIHIRCSPSALTFFARDHTKTSRIVAKISGEHVNWYFCEDEFRIGLNREKVEKMFASINKTFSKITMLVRHDDPENVVFILKDHSVEKEGNYKFTVSALEADDELFAAEEELLPEKLTGDKNVFPVQFTLSAKQFKQEVSDASNYSDTLTFEKLGRHPFQITYNKVGVKYNGVYRNSEKIKLYSEVKDGQTFRCTVKINNIKALASSMVTDDVRILAREAGDILFRSAIDDKALVVNTLTKLA